VFWVIPVYFNIRNTLPKFCPFLLGHPVFHIGSHKIDSLIFVIYDIIYAGCRNGSIYSSRTNRLGEAISMGHVALQLVEELRQESEGRGFDLRSDH